MYLSAQSLIDGKVFQREEQPNNVLMVKTRKVVVFNAETGEDEVKEVEQLVNMNIISGDIMPAMISWNDFKANDWKTVNLGKLLKDAKKK